MKPVKSGLDLLNMEIKSTETNNGTDTTIYLYSLTSPSIFWLSPKLFKNILGMDIYVWYEV